MYFPVTHTDAATVRRLEYPALSMLCLHMPSLIWESRLWLARLWAGGFHELFTYTQLCISWGIGRAVFGCMAAATATTPPPPILWHLNKKKKGKAVILGKVLQGHCCYWELCQQGETSPSLVFTRMKMSFTVLQVMFGWVKPLQWFPFALGICKEG